MTPLELTLSIIAGIIILLAGYTMGKRIGHHLANRQWEKRVPEIRKDAAKRSRAVVAGQFSEQLAPYLPDFPYTPTEAKFLGKPVDFLVFTGLDKKQVEEIVFVEVKSGSSRLSGTERSLRNAIEAGRVRYEEYHIPSNLTKP